MQKPEVPHAPGHNVTALAVEVFTARGGAPPYRGYHKDATTEIPVKNSDTVQKVCEKIKAVVDPSGSRMLEYTAVDPNNGHDKMRQGHGIHPDETHTAIAHDDDSGLQVVTAPDTPLSTLLNGKVLRVYASMPRGVMDIGVFMSSAAQDESKMTVGKEYLRHAERQPIDLATANELCLLFGAKSGVDTVKVFPPGTVVSGDVVTTLRRYVEDQYTSALMPDQDFKVYMTIGELTAMIGAEPVKNLMGCFGPRMPRVEDVTVVLRRCRTHHQLIHFHTDSSLRTLQLQLNSGHGLDYSGGEVLFVHSAIGALSPQRVAGTVTVHDNTALHGVTEVENGVRASLFLLETKAPATSL